jgi:hypothetical protein
MIRQLWLLAALCIPVFVSTPGAQETAENIPAAADTVAADGSRADSVVILTPGTATPHRNVAAAPDTDGDPEEEDDVVIVKETLDTVFIFDKKVFRHIAKDWRDIDIFRQRGYGLSGSTLYGAHAVHSKPIRNLIDRHLSGREFGLREVGFEPYLMSGGTGYIGLGEGFRLGGGGMIGEHRFFCADCPGESELVLSSRISYGGFLVEKAIVKEKWNLSFGGLIGAASNKVVISENDNSDLFSDITDFDDFEDINDIFDDPTFQAAYLCIEPHIGFSYTFFYFFHFGANIALPTFMPLEKFSPITDDFLSINPGLQVKLIFGNLG